MTHYKVYCTSSYENSIVKRARVRAVLGWVSSWEVLIFYHAQGY